MSKLRTRVGLFVLCAVWLLGKTAEAAEVKVFTSRAIATVLEKTGSEFERTTGHKLVVVSPDSARSSSSRSAMASRLT